MSKKGENIFLRKDGRWEARYPKDYDDEGRIIYGYVYAKTYTEVKKKKNQKLIELNSAQDCKSENPKFENIVKEFLNQKKITVKESTYSNYYELINLYIKPHFFEYKKRSLSLEKVIDIYNKHYISLSQKTIKDVLVLLNQILKFAKIDFRVPYPKTKNTDFIILSQEEIMKLEDYTFNNFNNITFGYLLSLYTGIRIGELCALKWSDIDLDNRCISINKTLERIKNFDPNDDRKTKIVINTPKSDNSVRELPIPSSMIPYITNLKKNVSNENDYFLTNKQKYIEPKSLRRKFTTAINLLDIDCKFHSLRHTLLQDVLKMVLILKH